MDSSKSAALKREAKELATKSIAGQLSDAEQARFDEVVKDIATHEAMFQQMDALGGNGVKSEPTLGAPALSFTKQQIAELHNAAENRQVKATLATTGAPQSLQTQYDLADWPFLRDQVRVLDLIPTAPANGSKIEYFRATAGATAAAAVAEGTAKPESTPTWESVTAVVRKIAHYIRANDEVIADFSNFLEVVGGEMLSGLIAQENEQLLNGSGTAPNLTGLLNTTGILTRAKGTDSNLDALFKATNDLRTGSSFVEPDVMILHPTDFGLVRTAKDGNGLYIVADPMSSPPFTLWGAKVVVTNRIAAGTALVANLKESARAYIREGPKLEVAPVGGGTTEFIANQSLIRAEERLALAVVRPTALVKVTGLA